VTAFGPFFSESVPWISFALDKHPGVF